MKRRRKLWGRMKASAHLRECEKQGAAHAEPASLQGHLLAEANRGEATITRQPRGRCAVNTLPLPSCMDAAHSQGPRGCTSATSTPNTAFKSAALKRWWELYFEPSANGGNHWSCCHYVADESEGISTCFTLADRDLPRAQSATILPSLCAVSFPSGFIIC